MSPIKVILTGATGLVGEGVLLECLANPAVAQVLVVGRRPSPLQHAKLKEALVLDFMNLSSIEDQLVGYDACFYCAGISSSGLSEAEYTHITYDIPMHFAQTVLRLNPSIAMCHVSGASTDATGTSRMMWARVKGRAENAMTSLGFAKAYNFRPGLMQPTDGQKNVKSYYKVVAVLAPLLKVVAPNHVCTLGQLARAMIHCVHVGFNKPVLEVRDILAAAAM